MEDMCVLFITTLMVLITGLFTSWHGGRGIVEDMCCKMLRAEACSHRVVHTAPGLQNAQVPWKCHDVCPGYQARGTCASPVVVVSNCVCTNTCVDNSHSYVHSGTCVCHRMPYTLLACPVDVLARHLGDLREIAWAIQPADCASLSTSSLDV